MVMGDASTDGTGGPRRGKLVAEGRLVRTGENVRQHRPAGAPRLGMKRVLTPAGKCRRNSQRQARRSCGPEPARDLEPRDEARGCAAVNTFVLGLDPRALPSTRP